VFAAPLGLISADISSGSTAKLTPSGAVTPPNRRVRSRTWRSGWGDPSPAVSFVALSGTDAVPVVTVASAMTSRPPALAASIGLDVPERAALGRLAHAQVELADVLVGQQLGPRTVTHDAAVLQHVAVVGDRERHRGVLLDQQHARALGGEVEDVLADLLLHLGSEAERLLVEQQHAG